MSDEETKCKPDEKPPVPQDKVNVSEHTIQLGKQKLEYTVTAGTLILKDEDEKLGEKPRASIFYVAYQLKNGPARQQRPVTFSFNGGPGSSSVWLHMGMIGPKRVKMADDGMPLPPPYELVDNEHTLLVDSDLVFIDPVSTGYSRAVPGEKPESFHGIKQDIESVGDFIVKWTTRNQRWASPKFLIGESYGTTRASGLSKYLQERHGMYLNGIMLVSVVLNFATLEFESGNDLPYPLILPSYAATAWFHGKLDKTLQQAGLSKVIKEATQYAMGDYTLGLMKGSALTAAERTAITAKLSRLTGLSRTYLQEHNLRVSTGQFCKELRRREGLTVGRLDSRMTGMEQRDSGETIDMDPSYSAILGPYTAAFYDYVRGELGFEFDVPYEIIKSLKKWTFDEGKYADVSPDLSTAFLLNPNLRVYIANGYYDLATPFLATEYTVNHLPLPASLAERVALSYFEAGHMMYLHLPSLKKLGNEVKAFIKRCTSA